MVYFIPNFTIPVIIMTHGLYFSFQLMETTELVIRDCYFRTVIDKVALIHGVDSSISSRLRIAWNRTSYHH